MATRSVLGLGNLSRFHIFPFWTYKPEYVRPNLTHLDLLCPFGDPISTEMAVYMLKGVVAGSIHRLRESDPVSRVSYTEPKRAHTWTARSAA